MYNLIFFLLLDYVEVNFRYYIIYFINVLIFIFMKKEFFNKYNYYINFICKKFIVIF